MLCDDLVGWSGPEGRREVQEGGDICILIVDSLRWTEETNTTLQRNYTLIRKEQAKKKKKKKKNSTSRLTYLSLSFFFLACNRNDNNIDLMGHHDN